WSSVPQARLQGPVLIAVVGFVLLLAVTCAFGRLGMLAGSFLGLAISIAASYFAIDGIRRKTHLFEKVRALVFGGSISDWVIGAVGTLLVLGLLWLLGLLVPWIVISVIGVGIAVGLYLSLSRPAELARSEPLVKVEEML